MPGQALALLFIVATTGPEFRPPWGMRSHHTTISLAPLDRAQVRDMIAELSARHALPREVVNNVAARTGGVPLFVEQRDGSHSTLSSGKKWQIENDRNA